VVFDLGGVLIDWDPRYLYRKLLAELRAAGTPLYALSNWSAETFVVARRRFEFLSWFDGVLVSGEERMIKPDPAFFRLLLDRFGLDPEATFYIDDNEANVAAARRLGLDAVRFTDPGRLRRELTARRALARSAPSARP
jgi:2-haloacid dehalogenase